jgi:hypothetical protein
VERPSAKHHDNLRNPGRSGNTLDTRLMDAPCRNLDSPGSSVEDPDATGRQMALAIAGNRWGRARDAGTGSVVNRCSSFRMEARRSSTSQE